ncbi:hypothetical protein HPB49_004742 [Dermacentor silvarum]|uniref:Uncharacterized protein n=1 Tax=Dermacentor silvarum TaxID=543639 RepID=A0ACB8CJE5_DERSI|nr:hypothetical protein HPB49_004742 [Dermacentor silvarum]
MDTEVEGELLTPEEFSKDSGWQTVAVRRSGAKSAPVERVGGISTGAKPNDNLSAKGRRDRGREKAKIIRGGRMPPLPKEDAKIIVRPMGGLNISKVGPIVVAEAIWNAVGIDPAKRDSDTMCPNFQQNIMVVSTPCRENATRYVRVECIAVGGQQHDVNAYEAAPHSTCKGVIRGIAPCDGPEELDRKIVNSKNPLALGAKRIKSTGTVVVVFDGYKVPIKLRLVWRYARQVYLIESEWRSKSPAFAKGERQLPDIADRSGARGSSRSRNASPSVTPGRSRSPSRERSRSRGRSRRRSGSRSVSRARSGSSVGQQMKRKSTLSWADRVRGGGETGPSRGPRDPLPEQARDAEIARLQKENADLKEMVKKMASEMTEMKLVISQSALVKASAPTAVEVPVPVSDSAGASKRRAVSSKEESVSQTNEIKGMLATLTTSVQQLHQGLAQVQRGLGALGDRIDALERLVIPSTTSTTPMQVVDPNAERLLSFSDILSYYRDERREYTPPAPSLTIAQAAHWRRLQTRTAPYPLLLHARYPDQFPSSCKLCSKPGDFLHTLLTCPTFPHPPSQTVAESYWETLLTCTSHQDQCWIISSAMRRIALQGLSFAL